MKQYMKYMNQNFGFKSLAFALSLLSFYACEKDIYITPPPYTPQIAMSAMLSNSDSLISMYVGRNYGIFENSQNYGEVLANANVKVYKDGALFDSIPLTNYVINGQTLYGYYRKYAQTLNEVYGNSSIEVRISHPDYPSCSATTRLPGNVTLQQTRYIQDAGVISDPFDGVDQTYDGVELTINDPANEENYYEVLIARKYMNWDSSYFVQYLRLPEGSYRTNGLYFSDKEFNGALHRKLVLFDNSFNDPNSETRLVWRNITKEKYIYLKSLEAYDNSNGNPFAEPANIYGNIQNGLGIFSFDREFNYRIL